jgi:hypothetical protein
MCISQETLSDTVHFREEWRRVRGKTEVPQYIGGVNKRELTQLAHKTKHLRLSNRKKYEIT